MNAVTRSYVFLRMLPALLGDRLHREERGQTAAEYLGIIVVISAIIAFLFTAGIGDAIGGFILNTISNIFSGTSN